MQTYFPELFTAKYFYRLLAAGQQEIEVVVLVVGTKLQNSSVFAVVGSRNSIKHHSSSMQSMQSMSSMCSMHSAVAACTLQHFSSMNSVVGTMLLNSSICSSRQQKQFKAS